MPAATQPDDPAPRDGVPPELLEQLHQANENFTRARQHLDEALSAEVNPFDERERATHEVHDAEVEIERIEEQIAKSLQKSE